MKRGVIIIGGGVGGLFCGALLAHEGFKVTVLKKNMTYGGGLQSFERFGCIFDTGMHVVGGLHEGGNVWRLCDYLGIADRLKIRHTDITDSVYVLDEKQSFQIASGEDGFVSSLSGYFPAQQDDLVRYMAACRALADEMNLFCLRPSGGHALARPSAEALLPADVFIGKYVSDARLRALLAYLNPRYGGEAGKTPAYVHAILTILYARGSSRFVDGSASFARLLTEVICQNDGAVLTNAEVVRIATDNNKKICFVELNDGSRFSTDSYIAAIHPQALLGILDERTFSPAYTNRLRSNPNTLSAFSVYVRLKSGSFPFFNYQEQCIRSLSDVWHFGRTDHLWPNGLMLMTPPVCSQPAFATHAVLTAPMSYEMVGQWESTKVGRRGEAYEEWKKNMTTKVLEMGDAMHPGLLRAAEQITAASPLTIRDYYAAAGGCASGWAKDVENIMLSQLPVRTKVSNLFLTGQYNNLHGFCGVALTAISTAEALLGEDFIVGRIAKK